MGPLHRGALCVAGARALAGFTRCTPACHVARSASASSTCRSPDRGGAVKSSTFILVGAFVATGAIVYQGTMAGASQRPTDAPAGATETELARSQSRTPTPAPSATASPGVVAAKTPALKLTLDQVRPPPRTRPPPR